MYAEIDPKLTKIAEEYLNEWRNMRFEIIKMTENFVSKIRNLKGYEVNEEALRCENINLDTLFSILDIENKYVNELISILITIARHRDIYENTINKVIPEIALQIKLKTHENEIINYIYSNLYDKLSNDEITKLIEEIKSEKQKISYYFSKENDKYALNFLDNRKFEISDKEKNPFGKLYVEAFSITDTTEFSAYMSIISEFNNIVEKQNKKTFYFMSLDRFEKMYAKFSFLDNRKVVEDAYSLYNNKELQLKLSSFILLHPICFELNGDIITYRPLDSFSDEVIHQLSNTNYNSKTNEFLTIISKLNNTNN